MTRLPAPSRKGHGHPWLTLIAVSLGLMMVTLDGTIVSIANPTIGRDLHASLAGLQWVTNGYLLAIATSLILGGKLGDLFGRKRMFLAGVAFFMLASLGCGLSNSIGGLIAFRVLQGLGGALMMPGTLSILRSAFPPKQLQMAVGVWAGTTSLATASGPIVGGLLVQHVNWQSIFFINLVVGALTLAIGWWVIAESRDEQRPRLDLPGTALLTGSLFALIWGIINAAKHGWGSGYTLGFLIASAVAFVVAGNTSIAQGVVPIPAGSSADLSSRITDASFSALTTGMHTTFVIAGIIVVLGGLVSLVWVRMKPGQGMLDFSAM